MRTLVFILWLVGNFVSQSTASPSDHLRQEHDGAVIMAVLMQLRATPLLPPAPDKTNPKFTLLVADRYKEVDAKSKDAPMPKADGRGVDWVLWMTGAKQLKADLQDVGWSVPETMRRDLERRTRSSPPLPVKELPSWVRVLSPTDDPNSVEKAADPDGAGDWKRVEFWPPGYSADSKQAVVRVLVSPFMHGKVATYRLERRQQGWRVMQETWNTYL